MRLIALALAMMATLASFGSNVADSVKVCFHAGQRQYDPTLGDNRLVMDNFIAKVRDAASTGDIERIIVRGYASPDGLLKSNERLAHNRCVTIADYIVSNAGISRDLIEESPMGVDWSELRRLVAETPDVPYAEKVLEILDNTPLWIFNNEGKIIDGRKKQLMDLKGGRPYNWMLANLFPQMRNAVAVTLSLKEKAEPQAIVAETATPLHVETVVEQPEQEEIAEAEEIVVPEEIPVTPEVEEAVKTEPSHHNFALKTNLLYDAVLFPNLELEWLINDNWSVSVEGDVAWWKPAFDRVYRLAVVSPEVRYHINPRAPWHGMYVGVFAGGGYYQLEHLHDGYYGEGGMAGASFGYMWPIGKHFSLEAEIGAGYLFTRYKVYHNRDGHKLYMRTENLNYFGPLKLKFSIAWRFDLFAKKSAKVSSTL